MNHREGMKLSGGREDRKRLPKMENCVCVVWCCAGVCVCVVDFKSCIRGRKFME